MNIEMASQTGQEQGRFAVSRFIPLINFENMLKGVPTDGVDIYLNNNLRIMLQDWGVSIDLPWFYRPVDHVFRRTLIRRAAVSVGLQPDKARLIVIETDSLHKNVLSGRPLPNDAFNADVRIWLLEKERNRAQGKSWLLEIDDLPSIMDTSIVLKKFGNSSIVEVQNAKSDIPIQILKSWCGLR